MLLVGAGVAGARVAKEMMSNPSVHIVGFLDDDPQNIGCVIAGVKVLGTPGMLAQLAKQRMMDEVLICTPPESRSSFSRFAAMLENLPITSKFMPTIDEIIENDDGLRLSLVFRKRKGQRKRQWKWQWKRPSAQRHVTDREHSARAI